MREEGLVGGKKNASRCLVTKASRTVASRIKIGSYNSEASIKDDVNFLIIAKRVKPVQLKRKDTRREFKCMIKHLSAE